MRIAAAGYYGGDPEKVMKASAAWVIKTAQYLAFTSEYEDVYLEMNRER